jgi:hypothetical protein
MDRSNEAQRLKAKLLSVWPDLAYIYAATTVVSDQTHTRNSSIAVLQLETRFSSGLSAHSAEPGVYYSLIHGSCAQQPSLSPLHALTVRGTGHAGGRRSGSAVADVLHLVVPRRARHHQDRREGGRAAGPAHGRFPAPPPLPRLLRAGKSSSMLIAILGSA